MEAVKFGESGSSAYVQPRQDAGRRMIRWDRPPDNGSISRRVGHVAVTPPWSRLGELLALEWTDIDFKNRLLTVMRNDRRGSIGAPKSGRDRKIPLTSRVTAALKVIRHLKGKLVFCWDDGSRWTNSSMRAGIKRQQNRAGLRVTGWHVLRHTFCSHLAMRGAPGIAIKELAGHASIAVMNRYTHLASGGAARDAIALLEPGRQLGDSGGKLT